MSHVQKIIQFTLIHIDDRRIIIVNLTQSIKLQNALKEKFLIKTKQRV